MTSIARLQLNQRRQRYETLVAKLGQLDPRIVLARGYAIVINEERQIVREASNANEGTNLKILLARDTVEARVTKSPAPALPSETKN
jgi:exodeoxyribonuclease VII large subunit